MRLYNNRFVLRPEGENDYDKLQVWGFKEFILASKCSLMIEKYVHLSYGN